ncbi:hypothetical protein CS022_19995 [Veronia nyctiphanis]|uniref:Uncharacterized protein n=1 Tax=Veronia nyctiphanis TaxID=1278244 RepID=A0A4Q0YLQ5_9GAMM|nr:hypothetical protein [Veronia nyctiphanis]RXJ71732.1 hypothetical protein CS022_19995 [Veronia nyctiphanis]
MGMPFGNVNTTPAHPPLPEGFDFEWHELPPELQEKLKTTEGMANFKKDWEYLQQEMAKGSRSNQKNNYLEKGWIFGGAVSNPGTQSGNPLNWWYKPKTSGDASCPTVEFDKIKTNSPLTFDLNGNGKVDTTGIGKTFDLDGDGKLDRTAWAGKGDGVLAFDANGDGIAGANGKELFGNNTDVDGDGIRDKLANGFDALRALAIHHLGEAAVADGKLGAAELAELERKAGLTMIVDGENKSLADLGITEINLGYTEAGLNRDENGNEHRQVGVGFTRNGQENQAVNDVWFKMQ